MPRAPPHLHSKYSPSYMHSPSIITSTFMHTRDVLYMQIFVAHKPSSAPSPHLSLLFGTLYLLGNLLCCRLYCHGHLVQSYAHKLPHLTCFLALSQGAFGSVLRTYAPTSSLLYGNFLLSLSQGAFGSVLHTYAPTSSLLYGTFCSVVSIARGIWFSPTYIRTLSHLACFMATFCSVVSIARGSLTYAPTSSLLYGNFCTVACSIARGIWFSRIYSPSLPCFFGNFCHLLCRKGHLVQYPPTSL